jgi:cyclic-di-AMP phosphodiesterase PgpH
LKIFNYIRAKHNLVLKVAMVLGCSFFITILLPTEKVMLLKPGFVDRIWRYNDIVLEEEILVKKTDAEIAADTRIIKLQSPLVIKKIIREDSLELKESTDNRNIYYSLKAIIDSVKMRGVIENIYEDFKQRSIFIFKDNELLPVSLTDFFTINSALQLIKSDAAKKRISVIDSDILNFITVNHFVDEKRTQMLLESNLAKISLYRTIGFKGEKLIGKGDILTLEKKAIIGQYISSRLPKPKRWYNFLSKNILLFILLSIELGYLAFFRKLIFGQNKQVAFLLLFITLAAFVTFIFQRYHLPVLAVPFAIIPILVRVFFDSRTALFTYLIAILVCCLYLPDKIEFILLQLIAGIATLFTVADMRKRQQIVNSAIIVLLFYIVIFSTYHFGFGEANTALSIHAYISLFISATLVLLVSPLIYGIEKLFGFVSDFKYLELCDLNQPLLRQLSQDVPGTFQHSLQVANLAEEAIYFIGGNTLLVRTGAMYHDIGKIYNPSYFTENQQGGYTPHIEMQPIESAKVIISHVLKGIELAKQHKLPEQIIDFIRTHHGTTSVGYFLNLYKQGAQNDDLNALFKYAGPIPFTKETAVLMLADGVEAASRSLKQHNALTISDCVDNIIDFKISQNQLINSDITFKDITLIKKIFKKRLITIYHARIEYPA